MELLTDDVLADVLRRLPPRSLAVSRCVCRAWRALIDAGDGMLCADDLPHSLAGLVICYDDHQGLPRAMLFARPGVGSDDYDIPGGGGLQLQDHCNGLLLFYRGVLNPATGMHATLPERVATTDRDRNHHHLEYEFLAFDPAVSSDYEVVMVPYVVVPPESKDVGEPGGGGAGAMLHSEWPPSPWILTVFSSATGLWEERSFLRRGEPAGTVADLRPNWWRNWREDGRAEYWRGMLYVHCETNFVMRISLSDSTYRVIKPPRCFGDHQEFVIGRSKKGIYSAFLDDKYRLWIWILDESCDDQIEWKLMHDSGRGIAFPSPSLGRGPWILYDLGSEDQDDEDEAQAQLDQHQDDQNEAQLDQEFEWNSDDDNDSNIILPTDDVTEERRRFVRVMAFHPYKEIVFFHVSSTRVMAYHLSSSKVQDLGALLPVTFMSWQRHEYIRNYFPYTPCWMGELPEEEFE